MLVMRLNLLRWQTIGGKQAVKVAKKLTVTCTLNKHSRPRFVKFLGPFHRLSPKSEDLEDSTSI